MRLVFYFVECVVRLQPLKHVYLFVLVFAVLATTGCPPDEPVEITTESQWEVVFEDLEGGLLSVWGDSPSNVWIVGSDPEDGLGPYILHYDGSSWERLDSGETGDLWWVSGDSSGNIWMAGAAGMIIRYDTSADLMETMETPGNAHLFGVFPISETDVWAVGGDLANQVGVAYHYDGSEWSEAADIPTSAREAGMFFKVWGRSADDLWIVGLGSVVLHKDTDGWTVFEDVDERLLTVHGNATDTYAVGGLADGWVVSLDDSGVTEITGDDSPQFNGVWVSQAGTVIAVGRQGSIWKYQGGEWTSMEDAPITGWDYHSVYIDPTGGIWAVGGFVLTPPLHDGLLTHWGVPLNSSEF